MVKIGCFRASNCDPDGMTYVICTPDSIIEDERRKYYDTCTSVSKSLVDGDMVEIVSPKGKLKSEKRSNDNEILDIEIK